MLRILCRVLLLLGAVVAFSPLYGAISFGNSPTLKDGICVVLRDKDTFVLWCSENGLLRAKGFWKALSNGSLPKQVAIGKNYLRYLLNFKGQIELGGISQVVDKNNIPFAVLSSYEPEILLAATSTGFVYRIHIHSHLDVKAAQLGQPNFDWSKRRGSLKRIYATEKYLYFLWEERIGAIDLNSFAILMDMDLPPNEVDEIVAVEETLCLSSTLPGVDIMHFENFNRQFERVPPGKLLSCSKTGVTILQSDGKVSFVEFGTGIVSPLESLSHRNEIYAVTFFPISKTTPTAAATPSTPTPKTLWEIVEEQWTRNKMKCPTALSRANVCMFLNNDPVMEKLLGHLPTTTELANDLSAFGLRKSGRYFEHKVAPETEIDFKALIKVIAPHVNSVDEGCVGQVSKPS